MRKKSLIIIIIGLAIVIIGALLVVSYYLDPARTLYAEGQTLMEKADYSAAIEKFQMLVDRFPDSGYAKEANTSLLGECYYKCGLSFETEQNYCDAVEKYQMALTYPGSSFRYSSEKAMMGCYYQWGQDLENQNNYAEALEKYQAIMEIDEYYTPTGSTNSIESVMLDCYYQWGQDLENQNNYAEALEKYQAIMEIDEYYFSISQSQEETIPQCYYEWVTYLVATNEYDEAIQKYSVIQKDYEFSVWASSEKVNVLRDVPDDVLFYWATRFRQENSYDTAIRLYEVIIQYCPRSEYVTQAEEAKIETEIAEIAEQEHGYLPPSSPISSEELGGDVEYTISNDTPYTLTVLLSGPSIRSVTISAGGTKTITLEPGIYETAAKVDDPTVIPYYGTDTLIGDTQYEVSFYISTTWGY